MITTALTEQLGIDHPIVLAPMGGVAGGRLAAAVADAGALGLIGGGYAEPEWLERELIAAGPARIGVGFITFALDERPDSLRLALDHGPIAVQLSFGDPGPYVDQIHAAGATLISQVQTLADARRAVEAGADIVVVQGQDSGGHGRAGRGTIGLVPAVVDAVDPVPVVAAGGLADGRGLAAALALGAAGITLGTRFFAAAEALSDPAAARLLVQARADQTVRTSAFDVIRGPAWPTGFDGRVVHNDTVDRWDHLDDDERAGDDVARHVLEARFRAAPETDYSVKPLWAGEGLDLIDAIRPAADIVASVVDQAVAVLERTAGHIRPSP